MSGYHLPRSVICRVFTLIWLTSSLLQLGVGLEGSIVTLRTFDEKLITESYPVPSYGKPVQHEQSLAGDFAKFSLTCSSCKGATKLVFPGGEVQVCVILSDGALSVLLLEQESEGAQAKLTQVLHLDDMCVPLYLKTFSSEKNGFAIICAGMSLHFGKHHSNRSISLESLSDQCSDSEHSGVLLESSSGDQHIVALSYIGENIIQECSVNSGTISNPELPQNVDCLTTSNTTVHPVHAPDMFMLQCTTNDGATLYVVNVPQTADVSEDARSIEAGGHPYSSPEGTYIAVVDSRRIVVYVTKNSSTEVNARGFSSEISLFQYLNDHTILILTENDDPILIDLKNASRSRSVPNGPPIVWTFIDPSNDYIYLVKSDELYSIFIVNETSPKPWYEAMDIVNQPEMLIFANKPANPTIPPETSKQSQKNGQNVPAIVGGTLGSLTLIVVLLVVTVMFMACKRRRYQLMLPPSPNMPTNQRHQQERNRGGRVVVHITATTNPKTVYDDQIPREREDNAKGDLGVPEIPEPIPSGSVTPPRIDKYVPHGTPPPQATPPKTSEESHQYAIIDNYLPATTSTPPPLPVSPNPPQTLTEDSSEGQAAAVYRAPPIPFSDNRSHPIDSASADGFTVRAEQENPPHIHTNTELAS